MFEQLLAALAALTAALNANTAARGASGGNAAAGASATVTVEQAREVMKKLLDAKGKDAVVAALATVNAKKLGDVKPEQLGSLVAAANKALTEAPAENLFG